MSPIPVSSSSAKNVRKESTVARLLGSGKFATCGFCLALSTDENFLFCRICWNRRVGRFPSRMIYSPAAFTHTSNTRADAICWSGRHNREALDEQPGQDRLSRAIENRHL